MHIGGELSRKTPLKEPFSLPPPPTSVGGLSFCPCLPESRRRRPDVRPE